MDDTSYSLDRDLTGLPGRMRTVDRDLTGLADLTLTMCLSVCARLSLEMPFSEMMRLGKLFRLSGRSCGSLGDDVSQGDEVPLTVTRLSGGLCACHGDEAGLRRDGAPLREVRRECGGAPSVGTRPAADLARARSRVCQRDNSDPRWEKRHCPHPVRVRCFHFFVAWPACSPRPARHRFSLCAAVVFPLTAPSNPLHRLGYIHCGFPRTCIFLRSPRWVRADRCDRSYRSHRSQRSDQPHCTHHTGSPPPPAPRARPRIGGMAGRPDLARPDLARPREIEEFAPQAKQNEQS
eukprot:gene22546-biopygen11755